MKLSSQNAIREVLAYAAMLAIFWVALVGLEQIELIFGWHSQAWITSWQRDSIYIIALVVGVLVANFIGTMSYMGVALIVFVGIQGVGLTIMLRMEPHSTIYLENWYGLFSYSVVACIALLLARQLTKRLSTFRQQAGSTGRGSAAPLN